MSADPGGVRTASGYAELLADADRPGGWLLTVDRVRQSYVDLDDPTYLDFEYIRHLADVLDALPAGPLAVTHIGGGALCFARYVAATRPGSPQVVLEPDAELTAFVRTRLPLPRGARIRIRAVDGRRGVADLRDASADVVVLDAFEGGRVPAELATAEFLADLGRVLRPAGVLLVNIADGPPLTYARRFVTTLHAALPNVVLMADSAVLRGRRYGNIELAASRAALPQEELSRAASAGVFPVRLLSGRSLRQFSAGAAPLTDAAAMRSAPPPEHSWRVSTS
jgi:SAM-dependent methyltransferase